MDHPGGATADRPAEVNGWIDSVLTAADYRLPDPDKRTRWIDAVVLHPVAGTLIFLVTMFAFFQTIFAVAAPLQDQVETFFNWLGGLVADHVHVPLLSAFLSQAVIGGIGGAGLPAADRAVVRADRTAGGHRVPGQGGIPDGSGDGPSRVGGPRIRGSAVVARLRDPRDHGNPLAAVGQDRLATMMGAPLMTCSARLPVYILLVSLLFATDDRMGPFNARGVVMFALYLLGAVSAMLVAAVFKKFTSRGGPALPFYMEMPPYQLPRLKTVTAEVWTAASAFLRKVTSIILITTIVLWALLNLPLRSEAELAAAGVDTADPAATSSYVLDHPGRFGGPGGRAGVFPVGLRLADQHRHPVFPGGPGGVRRHHRPGGRSGGSDRPGRGDACDDGAGRPACGRPLFDAPTIAALLVFFMYALQCMSTVGCCAGRAGRGSGRRWRSATCSCWPGCWRSSRGRSFRGPCSPGRRGRHSSRTYRRRAAGGALGGADRERARGPGTAGTRPPRCHVVRRKALRHPRRPCGGLDVAAARAVLDRAGPGGPGGAAGCTVRAKRLDRRSGPGEVLARVTTDLLDGSVGDFIRSHGGRWSPSAPATRWRSDSAARANTAPQRSTRCGCD